MWSKKGERRANSFTAAPPAKLWIGNVALMATGKAEILLPRTYEAVEFVVGQLLGKPVALVLAEVELLRGWVEIHADDLPDAAGDDFCATAVQVDPAKSSPRRRRVAQRPDPRRRRFRRMAGLARRRSLRSGDAARRGRGIGQPQEGARRRAFGAQRARAAHLRGAAACRRPDHARGFGGRVRRVARARAPDRGARLREGAAGGEEPRRCNGESGASAGALASNPLRWWENCRWMCRREYVVRNRMTRKRYRSHAPKLASYPRRVFISAVRETEMIADPKRKP